MILDYIQRIGQWTISFFLRLGRAHIFLFLILRSLPPVILRYRLILRELFNIGALSTLIIAAAGLFVGMVLGLQSYITLNKFGAEESLGALVGLSLVRELGPVISALLFAGRAGSALTAEIGLMKATEQLSAMEMMAVDPIKRIIAPRFIAGLISMPLLAAIFSVLGIWGGYLIGVVLLGLDSGSYWSQMQANIDLLGDIGNGVIKSIVFGWVVTQIALFEGYDATPTSTGVSHATTRTVVHSALAILGLDFVLTGLMFN